jgi:hypothetical protein
MTILVQNSSLSRKNSYLNCYISQFYVTFKKAKEISFAFSSSISYFYIVKINKRCEIMYYVRNIVEGLHIIYGKDSYEASPRT